MPEHIPKLPKSPLQEVIFQLYWQLGTDESGTGIDPFFRSSSLKFEESIKDSFPEKRLVQLPFKAVGHGELSSVRIINHPSLQFWKTGGQHPVVQIGEGVLAINQTEPGYVWSDFRVLIRDIVGQLLASYETPPEFVGIGLEYVDVVRVHDYRIKDRSYPAYPRDFINEFFKYDLSGGPSVLGDPTNVSVTHGYELPDRSDLNVRITSGRNKLNEPVIIWRTSQNRKTEMTIKDVFEWLDDAHLIARDLFKYQLLKPHFYESFKG